MVVHHACLNLRNTFSRLPNPRFAIADRTRGGRDGVNSIVRRWRQPSGTVTMTASVVTSVGEVSRPTAIWSEDSEMLVTAVERCRIPAF